MKKIIVACGTGMATSTMISEKIKQLLSGSEIPYQIVQCQLSEIEMHQNNADLIVTSMKVQKQYDAPVIVGTPFLIGMGEDTIKEKIMSILKDEE